MEMDATQYDEDYSYTREKLNNNTLSIQYSKPSKTYGQIEVIHPVTSKFINNIHDYVYNNKINDKHVENIYNDILQDEDKIIIGCFSVIQCDREDNKLYLIDGHHRRQALLKILQNNKDNIYIDSISIEIKLYHVEKLNSDKTFNLYKKINNVKPYMIKTNEDVIREITEKLVNYTNFNKCLKICPDNKTKCNFPYFNRNEFVSLLSYKLSDRTDINSEEIVNNIISFNDYCRTLPICELFQITSVKYEKHKTMYDKRYAKVKTLNCFLKTPYGEQNWHFNI
jgi:hypothetical protein